MENERIRAIYDRHARGYDRGEAATEWLLGRRLRRRILDSASGDVLEVGVGTGASLGHYPPGCRVTGVDLSAAMLAAAREKAALLGLPVTLHQGDAQRLPFGDGSFDTCVSQLTLCTVPDPAAALRELRRVCRPDGSILLLEHTTSTNPVLACACRLYAPLQARALGCHLNRPILELTEQAGLRVRRVERHVRGIVLLIWARP